MLVVFQYRILVEFAYMYTVGSRIEHMQDVYRQDVHIIISTPINLIVGKTVVIVLDMCLYRVCLSNNLLIRELVDSQHKDGSTNPW